MPDSSKMELLPTSSLLKPESEQLRNLRAERHQLSAAFASELYKLSPRLAEIERRVSDLDKEIVRRMRAEQLAIGLDESGRWRLKQAAIRRQKLVNKQVLIQALASLGVSSLASVSQAQTVATDEIPFVFQGHTQGATAFTNLSQTFDDATSRGLIGWGATSSAAIGFSLGHNDSKTGILLLSWRAQANTLGPTENGFFAFHSADGLANFDIQGLTTLTGSGLALTDAEVTITYTSAFTVTNGLNDLQNESHIVAHHSKATRWSNPSERAFSSEEPIPEGATFRLAASSTVTYEVALQVQADTGNGQVDVRLDRFYLPANYSANRIFRLRRTE